MLLAWAAIKACEEIKYLIYLLRKEDGGNHDIDNLELNTISKIQKIWKLIRKDNFIPITQEMGFNLMT